MQLNISTVLNKNYNARPSRKESCKRQTFNFFQYNIKYGNEFSYGVGRRLYSRLYVPVVSAADDVFAIKPNASYELLVSLKNTQTRATFDVPQSNGIITTTTNY